MMRSTQNGARGESVWSGVSGISLRRARASCMIRHRQTAPPPQKFTAISPQLPLRLDAWRTEGVHGHRTSSKLGLWLKTKVLSCFLRLLEQQEPISRQYQPGCLTICADRIIG